MNKIYCFDLDGTLIDSMPAFYSAMKAMAKEDGVEYDEAAVKKMIPLGYTDGGKYYIERYGLSISVAGLTERLGKHLYNEYANNISLKNGVGELLKKLSESGSRLFVLTASPRAVVEAALKKNRVFELFEKVWSIDDFSLTKSSPEIFVKVANIIGCDPCQVNYFDDSLIALKNAKAAGFVTYAVHDAQNEEEIKRIREGLSNYYVEDFREFSV